MNKEIVKLINLIDYIEDAEYIEFAKNTDGDFEFLLKCLKKYCDIINGGD